MTSQPCKGKSFVQTEKKVWTSQWSVILRTFYRQILSLLYSSFSFWNFRHRLARELLVSYSSDENRNVNSGSSFGEFFWGEKSFGELPPNWPFAPNKRDDILEPQGQGHAVSNGWKWWFPTISSCKDFGSIIQVDSQPFTNGWFFEVPGIYCWWKTSRKPVDMVVYPILYKGVLIPQRWLVLGFLNHQQIICLTPLKTNMSPENQSLEDVFPTKIVPF